MADDKETSDGEAAPGKQSGGIVKMAIMGVGLIGVMIGVQLGTLIIAKSMMPEMLFPDWMLALQPVPEVVEELQPKQPLAPAVYTRLNPSIVVSYQEGDTVRFLQVTLEAMARDEESIAAFELHTPQIRNNLLALLSDEDLEELTTREGKDRVRKKSLEEVQSILAAEDPNVEIEDLYFTSFVLQ